MYSIIGRQSLNDIRRRIDIRAEDLVRHTHPGQFIALMPETSSRPRPFVVYDADQRRRCLSIVFDETDAFTRRLFGMKVNDPLHALQGPFGVPCVPEKKGTYVFAGEATGLASLIGMARSFRASGSKVIGIAGFSSRRSSLLENQLRLNTHKCYVMYGDGMAERKGDILIPLKKVLAEEQVARIYLDASPVMMREVYYLAWSHKVPVSVSLREVIEARGDFDPRRPVLIREGRYYPSVDGIFVDGEMVDIHEIMAQIHGPREYERCRREEAEHASQRNVFARFKKFIWG
ncbi:MAG: hypothetical protein GX606_03475 [Elusimicrobia bacterium]|nr:hypothetical protein [Elusimicrobiota bacterium]